MLYVGLDVSMRRTAICILAATGKVVCEVSVATIPAAIAAAVGAAGGKVERVGLEAGMGSAWLARGLLAAGLPVIVIEAAHAAGVLRAGFRNKTDRNDARGIADLMRVNKFRAVWVKSPAAQRDRALPTVRERLRGQSLDARNTMWAMLQAEGLDPPGLSNPAFAALVAEMLEDQELGPLLRPLAVVVELLERQLVELDKGDRQACEGQLGMQPPADGPRRGTAGGADLRIRARRARAVPQRPDRRRPFRPDPAALPVRRDGLVRANQSCR